MRAKSVENVAREEIIQTIERAYPLNRDSDLDIRFSQARSIMLEEGDNPVSLGKQRHDLMMDSSKGVLGEPYIEGIPRYTPSKYSVKDSDGKWVLEISDDVIEELSQYSKGGPFEGEDEELIKRLQIGFDAANIAIKGKFPPYTHQVESIIAHAAGKNIVIATGTGSGKTEAFLWPMLTHLGEACNKMTKLEVGGEPLSSENNNYDTPDRGIKTLIMYPMNALVADQMTRLRDLLGDKELEAFFDEKGSPRCIQFGMYTSRTPAPGWLYDRNPKTGRMNLNSKLRDKVKIHAENFKNIKLSDPELYRYLGDKNKLPEKYSGGTEPDLSDFIDNGVLTGERDKELVARHEMHMGGIPQRWEGKKPLYGGCPDVLVTNYSMLEYMLLRPIEHGFWEDTRNWMEESGENLLIVLDEAHLYNGTLGAEIAMLLQRLLLNLRMPQERLQFIVTSASLGDLDSTEGKDKAKKFLRDLTGSDGDTYEFPKGLKLDLKKSDGVFQEVELNEDFILALANVKLKDRDSLISFIRLLDDEIAEKIQSGEDKGTCIYQAIEETDLFVKTYDLLQFGLEEGEEVVIRPRKIVELKDHLFGEDGGEKVVKQKIMATESWLELIASAQLIDGKRITPLMPIRAHYFARGMPELFACIKCRKLHETQKEFCNQDDCNGKVFELFSDRNCGAPFYQFMINAEQSRRRAPNGSLEILRTPIMKDGSIMAWGTQNHELSRVSMLGYFVDDFKVGCWKINLNTGRMEELSEPIVPSIDEAMVLLAGWNPDGWNFNYDLYDIDNRIWSWGAASPHGSIVKGDYCPSCSRNYKYKMSAQITNLQTRGQEVFVRLTHRLVDEQDPVDNELAKRQPNEGRKALIFSDGRQQAASLAGELQRIGALDNFRSALLTLLNTSWLNERPAHERTIARLYPTFVLFCAYQGLNPFDNARRNKDRTDFEKHSRMIIGMLLKQTNALDKVGINEEELNIRSFKDHLIGHIRKRRNTELNEIWDSTTQQGIEVPDDVKVKRSAVLDLFYYAHRTITEMSIDAISDDKDMQNIVNKYSEQKGGEDEVKILGDRLVDGWDVEGGQALGQNKRKKAREDATLADDYRAQAEIARENFEDCINKFLTVEYRDQNAIARVLQAKAKGLTPHEFRNLVKSFWQDVSGNSDLQNFLLNELSKMRGIQLEIFGGSVVNFICNSQGFGYESLGIACPKIIGDEALDETDAASIGLMRTNFSRVLRDGVAIGYGDKSLKNLKRIVSSNIPDFVKMFNPKLYGIKRVDAGRYLRDTRKFGLIKPAKDGYTSDIDGIGKRLIDWMDGEDGRYKWIGPDGKLGPIRPPKLFNKIQIDGEDRDILFNLGENKWSFNPDVIYLEPFIFDDDAKTSLLGEGNLQQSEVGGLRFCRRCYEIRMTEIPPEGSREPACVSCGYHEFVRYEDLEDSGQEHYKQKIRPWRKALVEYISEEKEIRHFRAEEHTAQISTKLDREDMYADTEKFELLFQDIPYRDMERIDGELVPKYSEPAIDILSCTTTMEVGIDIGSLTMVGLRTIPPNPANYQQRVGRAGRGSAEVSIATTWIDNTPYAQSHFQNPLLIIKHNAVAPIVHSVNKRVLKRHIKSCLISQFFKRMEYLTDERAFDGMLDLGQSDLMGALGGVHSFFNDEISQYGHADFLEWLDNKDVGGRSLYTSIYDKLTLWDFIVKTLPDSLENPSDHDKMMLGGSSIKKSNLAEEARDELIQELESMMEELSCDANEEEIEEGVA